MIIFYECVKLNTLNMIEYASILANLNLLYRKNFQCLTREFKTAKEKELHEKRNKCNYVMKDRNFYHKIENVRYKTCYCNFYNPNINILIQISQHYEKFGELPKALTKVTMISSKMQKIHNIIQSFLYQLQMEEMKKQEQKIKNR